MECPVADVVPLLGVVIIFCLRGVGEIGYTTAFMNSDGLEVVFYFWCLICDVCDRRMLFYAKMFLNVETWFHQI